MKPVQFDIVMRDKTRQAWQDVQQGARQTGKTVQQAGRDIKQEMAEQSAVIKKIEGDIKQLEKQLEKSAPGKQRMALTAELSTAKKVLQEEKGALAELGRQVESTVQKQETLRTQIAKLKQEMVDMKEGTQEYAQAMAKLGEMQDRYVDISTQARIHSDDNKNIKGMVDALTGLSGAMTAGVGVASLFGAEKEKLVQIQTKLQAVMAVTIGIQQVANTLNKDSFFTHTLLAKGKALLTAANTRLAASLKISTVAAQALMATLTMGLSIAITVLIAAMNKYSTEREKAARKAKEMVDIEADGRAQMIKTRFELNALISSLKNFSGTKQQEKAKVEELNRKYGEQFGYYKTTAEWYDVLIEKSAAYTDVLFLQAKAQKLVNKAIEADEKAQQIHAQDPSDVEGAMGWFSKIGLYLAQSSSPLSGVDASKMIKEHNEKEKQALIKAAEEERDAYLNQAEEVQRQAAELAKSANIGGFIAPNNTPKVYDIAAAELTARQKIEAMRIQLMREGAEKEKAEARKRLNDELERIASEERERMKALMDARKEGLPVTREQVKEVTAQADTQRELAGEIYLREVDKIQQDAARREKELWEEANALFRSELENRLAEIDSHYDKQVKLAGENRELIDALNTARDKEKKEATGEAKMQALAQAEQIELQRQAIVMEGLGFDELAEVQRNNIIIRFARERIKVLQSLGEKQHKEEIEQLQNTIDMLTKKNSRRSLTSLFDEKAFAAVEKHYLKIYKDADKAKEKTENLFASIKKGGEKGADAIGMLQGVFGGLSEELDAALSTVGNIAQGFAQGGVAGGIMAVAGELKNFIAKGIKASKEHREALRKIVEEQKAYLRAYRMMLLEEQLAYKQGTNIFGTDEIGRALQAVYSYRDAVVELKKELRGEKPKANLADLFDFGADYRRRMKAYGEGLAVLDRIQIKTGHKKGKITNLWKGKDIYSAVTKLPEYKNLVGEDGRLDLNMAKAILSTRTLKAESKQLLEMLVELQEHADKAYQELEQSLKTTFGTLGTHLTNSIANAFAGGLIAAEEFKKGVTDVLAELASQMVYSLFLREKFDKLQEDIKKVYMTTGIDEREIARRTTDLIGDFFRGMGTQIEAANKFQEEFWQNAERNGFDRPGSEAQQARTGAFTALSQEQGTKLEGLFTSVQDHLSGIRHAMEEYDAVVNRVMEVLGAIAANTAHCRLLEDVVEYFERIERNGIKTQ